MELLRLKRRVTLAKKGHKLLKDKLDGLIGRLLNIVKSHRVLSRKIEDELISVFQKLLMSSGLTSKNLLYAASLLSSAKSSVDISIQNIMGVKIPKYSFKSEGNPISYGFAQTPGELDQALMEFKQILPDLISLAEHNKAIQVIASSIIEIKRRVNALEYILIPELDSSVKQIVMKLAEMERSNTVTLMKIKDMVRGRS